MVDKYIVPNITTGTLNLSSGDCADSTNKLAEIYAAETLEIAGAPINVFQMLGIHEQGQLIDLVGTGNPISSGTAAGYLLADAFNNSVNVWRSLQTGAAVLTSCYLGYSFGTKKNIDGTEKYAPPQPVRQHITTIRIQQGPYSINHVTQARVERSDDGGLTWKKVDVVNLPDTTNLETISVKQSSPAQMWRLVPLAFNGAAGSDPWEVVALELMDYTQTSIDNVEDFLLMENRDRDYAQVSIQLKAHYDLLDVQTELTKFGIDIPEQFIFTLSFAKMIEKLGRPLLIGDVIELPSEKQYDQHLNAVKKYLEVTDVAWSTEGYTPGWKPILSRVYAQPMLSTQETRDILGTVDTWTDEITDADLLNNTVPIQTVQKEITDVITADSKTAVPETGEDYGDYAQFASDATTEMTVREDLYAEDGLPPNNLPYTEGATFPVTPADGDYHRLTYPADTRIPVRLFQWNAIKNRWLFLEVDRRSAQSAYKPSVKNILNSSTKTDINKG